MKLINYKKEKGFTLVETLIAISILMIAIASPINLAQKALSSAVLSRDQMTASFLAQDGLESVKNLRDEIAIRSDSENWLSPFSDPSNPAKTCICVGEQCNFDNPNTRIYCNIDSTHEDLRDSIVGSNELNIVNPLKIETNGDLFIKYNLIGTAIGATSEPSKFARLINIMLTNDPNEAVVQVRVCWPFPTCEQKVDIKDFIYNYSPNLL